MTNEYLEQLRAQETALTKESNQREERIEEARLALAHAEHALHGSEGDQTYDQARLREVTAVTTLDEIIALQQRIAARKVLLDAQTDAVTRARNIWQERDKEHAKRSRPLAEIRQEIAGILDRERKAKEEKMRFEIQRRVERELQAELEREAELAREQAINTQGRGRSAAGDKARR